MKLWRREREQPVAHDPELEARIADVLHRHGTYRGRDSVLYAYKAEARRRQQRRAGATAHPQARPEESRFQMTPDAAPPQPHPETLSTPPPILEAVPSVAPAEGHAPKTKADFEREQFVAFETLCGNGDRIAERVEEARSYEPEDDALPEYLW